MITCYLGLGSNLRSPERQLRQAIHHLRKMPRTVLIQVSPLYFNDAVGRRAHPSYCNAVVKIKTTTPPLALLKRCLALEEQQQRTRKIRWGARTLDVDILLYGQKKLHHPKLIIPHPRMLERDFVLKPMGLLL